MIEIRRGNFPFVIRQTAGPVLRNQVLHLVEQLPLKSLRRYLLLQNCQRELPKRRCIRPLLPLLSAVK